MQRLRDRLKDFDVAAKLLRYAALRLCSEMMRANPRARPGVMRRMQEIGLDIDDIHGERPLDGSLDDIRPYLRRRVSREQWRALVYGPFMEMMRAAGLINDYLRYAEGLDEKKVDYVCEHVPNTNRKAGKDAGNHRSNGGRRAAKASRAKERRRVHSEKPSGPRV
jgi:hypothetical protein